MTAIQRTGSEAVTETHACGEDRRLARFIERPIIKVSNAGVRDAGDARCAITDEHRGVRPNDP